MLLLAAVVALATVAGLAYERRHDDVAERAARRLMSGILWLLLPPIAFFQVARLELEGGAGAGIAFGYVVASAVLATAWLAGRRLLRLSRAGVGTLMLVAVLANTGYLGLPFSVALFGFDELPRAVAYDALVSAVMLAVVGFSIGAAFGTVASGGRERVTVFFSRNPVLGAAIAGLLVPDALAPDAAVQATRGLLFAIVPLGFFAVGVTLGRERSGGRRLAAITSPPTATAVALKLVLAPALMLGLAAAFVEVPDSYLTQSAMPSALNCVVLAEAYGLDRGLAAAAIAWTTGIVIGAGLIAVAFVA